MNYSLLIDSLEINQERLGYIEKLEKKNKKPLIHRSLITDEIKEKSKNFTSVQVIQFSSFIVKRFL